MKRRALNQLDPDSNVEAKYEDGEELDEVDDEEKIQARPKAKARKKVTSNAGTATAGSAPITGTGSLFASVLASSSSAQTTNTTFTNGEGKTTEMTVVAPAPDAQISQTNGGSSSSSEEKREEPKTESEDNTNKKEEEEEKKKKEGGETLAKNETGSNGASETSASTTTGASSSPAKTQTISFGWQKEAADPKSTSKSFSSAFASIPSTSGDQSKPGFGSFGAASSFGSTGSFGSGSFGTGSFGSGGFGTGSFGSGGFGSLGSFGSSGTSSSSSSASSLSTPTPAALPAVPAPTPTSFGAAPSFWASTIETKSFQWGKKAEDGTDPASTSLSSNTELVSSSGLFPTTSSVSSTGSSAPQEPVSNGEEEEERVLSLKKIKIYEVVKKVEDEKEKKVTVERGEASLRLNRLKSDPSKSRIVARDANGTFRLILNMKIFKTIGIVKRSETVIALVGFKIDEGQDTPVPATFLLKMSESDAEKTYKALLDLRQSSEDVSPSGSSDTL